MARAAALAGARPVDAPALDPRRLARALDRLAAIAAPTEPPPEIMGRTITITERAEIIRAALRDAPRVVLQDLLTGVRDRVVIAITFLAMLELMKRREIVVEQATPWGPIVARETTADERAAAGVAAAPRRPDRRVAGVVRMTDAVEPIEVPSTEEASGEPAGDGPFAADGAAAVDAAPGAPAVDGAPAPIELTEAALEALLFVAEKPLSRREIAALAGTDRATVDARLGDLEVSLRDRGIRLLIDGDRVELATASDGGALVARYIGADVGPAVAGLARDPRDRRLPPAGHEGRRSSGSAASIRTTRSGRCSIAGSWSSSAGPPLPAGRSCTAPASSSSSGSR